MTPGSTQSPLDPFIPNWDARERYAVTVKAPASVVYRVAMEFDARSLLPVQMLFTLRTRMMGGTKPEPRGQSLIAETRSLGWGVLDERPGTLYLSGAACRPWIGDVTFTTVAPERFRDFAEPDQVKIAWSIETTDRDHERSELVSETRVVATDGEARRKFLEYWGWARHGIHSIRWFLLPGIRRRAEKLYRRGG